MIIDAKVDPDQLEELPPFSRRDPHATPSRAYSVPASQDSTEYDRHKLLAPPPRRLGELRATGSTPDLRLVVESPTGSSIQTSPTLPGSSSQAGLGQWHATGSSLTLIPLHFMQKGSIAITGTYHIDPRASAVGFDDTKGFQSKKKAHPQASFRTKHGEISLSLSTTGKTKREGQKVDVLVASWSGNITVQLLTPAPESPAMGLEVFSVRGDILLLLPLTYSGMFHVKSHWGSLKFLPNFKKAMKVIHEADSEAIVMLGDHLVKDKSPVNFAQMKTRFGSIIIGFSGVDSHDFKNGFWQTVMKRF